MSIEYIEKVRILQHSDKFTCLVGRGDAKKIIFIGFSKIRVLHSTYAYTMIVMIGFNHLHPK